MCAPLACGVRYYNFNLYFKYIVYKNNIYNLPNRIGNLGPNLHYLGKS
jgi:hypothetical protein